MSKKSEKIGWQEYLKSLQDQEQRVVYADDVFKKLSKKELQNLIYANTFTRLKNILLKLYKWEVPETISARAIELGLMSYGMVCGFKSALGKYILPCIGTNMWNVYGDPISVRAIGYNGYQEEVEIDYGELKTPLPSGMTKITVSSKVKGIFMRDNDSCYPYIYYIKEYAYKLTDKIMALNIATQRLKSPFEYVVDEKELKDTVEKLVEKKENNDDVIIRVKPQLDKDINNSVQLVENKMNPAVVQAIKDSIEFDFNMFLETIGINSNPSPDKSQYVNNSEVGSNNSLIDIEQDVRFMNREKFAKEISEYFGEKITVKKNTDEAEQEAMKMKKAMMEGGINNEPNNSAKQGD